MSTRTSWVNQLTEDVANLRFAGPGCSSGFNDCITSIRVFAP